VGPKIGSSLFVFNIKLFKEILPKNAYFKAMQAPFSRMPFCIPAYNGLKEACV